MHVWMRWALQQIQLNGSNWSPLGGEEGPTRPPKCPECHNRLGHHKACPRQRLLK